jgi:hypothetical protein
MLVRISWPQGIQSLQLLGLILLGLAELELPGGKVQPKEQEQKQPKNTAEE